MNPRRLINIYGNDDLVFFLILYESLSIQWLGHAGFVLSNPSNQRICIDPFRVKDDSYEPVDVIISTHEHADHCSLEDMNKFISPDTEVIGIDLAKDKLEKLSCKKIHYVKPGDMITVKDIEFEIVSAYNLNKFRPSGEPFHPKVDNKIGVIVNLDGFTVYHTGDSDLIPEMSEIHPDVALLPVSGTYVMTVSEAIEATEVLQPKLVIPMHFGAIVGSEEMAGEFKQKTKVNVEIPTLE